MEAEEVVKTFMVDLDYDTKNYSVAGQALDMMLRLVAPEAELLLASKAH